LIECLPSDLLASIEVDISGLVEYNDSLLVSDITLPENIEILTDTEHLIAKIEAPRKAEDLEALDEEIVVGGAEPEVITEAREEDE
jgi:large subunit ribosomal protein L25